MALEQEGRRGCGLVHVPYCSSFCVCVLEYRLRACFDIVIARLQQLGTMRHYNEKSNSEVCLCWSFWSGNCACYCNVRVKLVEFHCTYTAAWNILKYELADLMRAVYMSVASSEFD